MFFVAIGVPRQEVSLGAIRLQPPRRIVREKVTTRRCTAADIGAANRVAEARSQAADGTWRLGPSDAIHRGHATTARHRSCGERRSRDGETLPASLPEIHELLRVPQSRQPNRQRHRGIRLQADCDRTPEAVRHALETRRSPTDPDSAVNPPEPNLGCHVEERINSTASRQRPKLSTSPVISLLSVLVRQIAPSAVACR